MKRQSVHTSWKLMNSEEAFGIYSIKRAWISHRDGRNQSDKLLYIGSQIYPMSQAINNPETKVADNREWEKLEKLSARNLEKMKRKKEITARTKKEKKSFCHIIGYLSSQGRRDGSESSETQRQSRTLRRHCKKWFCFVHNNYRTRIIYVTNDDCKSDELHYNTFWLCRTSRRRSICQHSK